MPAVSATEPWGLGSCYPATYGLLMGLFPLLRAINRSATCSHTSTFLSQIITSRGDCRPELGSTSFGPRSCLGWNLASHDAQRQRVLCLQCLQTSPTPPSVSVTDFVDAGWCGISVSRLNTSARRRCTLPDIPRGLLSLAWKFLYVVLPRGYCYSCSGFCGVLL